MRCTLSLYTLANIAQGHSSVFYHLRRSGLLPNKEDAQFALPLDNSQLEKDYVVMEKSSQRGFEFLSNASIGEESRERLFQQDMLVLESDDFAIEEHIDDSIALAESALKVC